MKFEVLFPEYCNLYGDPFNVEYLLRCFPAAERIDTPLCGEPAFLGETPDLIYMAPCPERTQAQAIAKLMPHKDRLLRLIDGGTVFLLTGNAMEVFGGYIENEDGTKVEGLGILPMHAKRDMMHRHNSVFLGGWQDHEIIGFKSQFTMAWPDSELRGASPLFSVKKGVGLNKKCDFEGLRLNNLFATYLLGPVLLLNPGFARSVLDAMGHKEVALAFDSTTKAAHEQLVKDFYRYC